MPSSANINLSFFESSRPPIPRSWWLAGLPVILGILVGFWPNSPFPTVSLMAPLLLVIWASLRAWRTDRHHPLRPSWLLLALGMSLTLTGELFRFADDIGLLPERGMLVGCNLAAYPFYLAMHLFRVWRLAGRNLSGAALLDALICVLAVGALGAQVMLPGTSTLPPERLIGVALPPLMTLALLLITGYLVYLSPRTPSASALLLMIVAFLTTVANWLVAVRILQPHTPGTTLTAIALFIISFLLLAALPGLDRRPAPQAIDPSGPLLSVIIRSVPLVLVGLLTLQIATIHHTTLDHNDPSLFLIERALAAATLLVLARQWLVLRANASLLRALLNSNQALLLAHDQAQREARTDALTGLPNQRFLREHLEPALAYHRRNGLPMTVLFLDLDHFKQVNDDFGHPAGNAVLVEVGRRLRHNLRDGDVVARFGGEEFVALLPGTTTTDGVTIAERLRQCISDRPMRLSDTTMVALTISIGLVTCQASTCTAETLLAAADDALYGAKQAGRNRVYQTASAAAN